MKKKKFLEAEWQKLVLVNYKTDPEVLQKYLPENTELDLWNNTCYVSLVGFRFVNTKLKGIKVPFHVNFEEVNLRFYVKYKDGDTYKRGVVFISEIVPKFFISSVANLIYNEHYRTQKMRYLWKLENNNWQIGYSFKNKNWQQFEVMADNKPEELTENSEAWFITQHFWGYSGAPGRPTIEYEVEHPAWKIYPVRDYKIQVDFANVYGREFEFLNVATPVSVFLAEGSEIVVRNRRKIK